VGSVTVKEWFAKKGAKLKAVTFESGPEMLTEDVEWWCSQPNGELPKQE
jgi:hypothetical protein